MQLVQQILLSRPQLRLVQTEFKFPAFVGGFGSGKTEALINRGMYLKCKHPEVNMAYYMPTFDLVYMIGIPRFEEKLEEYCIPYKTIKSPRPMIHIENANSVIFRTMDNPGRIVGYEVGDSLVDEIDIMKEKDADASWKKILARNRQKKADGSLNTIAVGCTPEGFKFVYKQWGKDQEKARSEGYELIRASTYSNLVNLPADYIANLEANYPTSLVQAYIWGQFVNLLSGAVYPEFDRVKNGSTELVGTYRHTDGKLYAEDLHIGMDFNVTKMAAVVFVRRDGWPHAVAEFTKIFDTPAMIKAIKNRYPNNRIFIYPDASGGSRRSVDASKSDIDLLRQAGFNIMAKESNPAIKDRVLSKNVLICNGKGERNFFVNINECPNYVDTLQTQAYDQKTGDPDKTAGLDHLGDAGGYFTAFAFPVRGKPVSSIKMVGL